MARAPRKTKSSPPSNKFLEALKFLTPILKKDGDVKDTHVLLSEGWAIANNGILAAGTKIDEALHVYPHAEKLAGALSKCGQASITQLDESRLSIKSDKMRAIVPCVDPAAFHVSVPDAAQGPLDERFVQAAKAVAFLVQKEGEEVVTSSILLNGQSVVATDRMTILEYWHGLSLPTNISVPPQVIAFLSKTDKKITAIGCGHSSITFWFEDGAWVRTQLFAEKWPDLNRILNVTANPLPIVNGFFEGLEAIEQFSEDGFARLTSERMTTHDADNIGAQYELKGLPNGIKINIKRYIALKNIIKKIDWFTAQGNIIFFGDNIRGAIAGSR